MNSRQTDDELMRLSSRRMPTPRTSSYPSSPRDSNAPSSSVAPDDEPGAIVSASKSFPRSDSGGASGSAGGSGPGAARHARSLSLSSTLRTNVVAAGAAPREASFDGIGAASHDAASAPSPRPPASAFRDRPWRVDGLHPSGGSVGRGSFGMVASSSRDSRGSVGSHESGGDDESTGSGGHAHDDGNGSDNNSNMNNATSSGSINNDNVNDNVSDKDTSELSSRWAQYETDSLTEESRLATSNAVVDMATRLADRQAASFERDSLMGMSTVAAAARSASSGNQFHDVQQVESPPYNYNSRSHASSMSTKDYVKGRLSTLLSSSHRNSTRNSFGSTHSHEGKHANQATTYCDDPNDYDKVRSEAIKMLQIADRIESSSSPTNIHNSSKLGGVNATTGLFKTKGGGYSMRQFDADEWDQRRMDRGLSPSNSFRDRADDASNGGSPVINGGGSGSSTTSSRQSHINSSIAGLEKYAMEQPNLPQYDGTFAVDSHDEQDPTSIEYIDEDHASEKTKSSWSSRYSVERQLMAITGGLDSRALCDKMDRLHHSHSTRSAHSTSARGMFRSSPAAMDGNNMDYDDYTSNSSTYGAGYGNSFGGHYWWNYVKGTLWSEIREDNYDGTTQSLVRIEKRKRLRRRIWGMLIGLLTLVVVVSVLVVVGNPKEKKTNSFSNASAGGASHGGDDTERSEDVTFYVLADEPYDFADIRRLTLELESLPSDAEFLVHLGNANSDAQSQCQEYGYERSANILKESPVPVFVIPGDVDWATCRKPERALQYWAVNFGKFEKNFQPHDFKVDYQPDRVENFAFLHRGVLFLSVHIVEAETDSIEWTTRHERNVMWTKEKLSQYEPSSYRAVVIFGHAAPSSKQGEYFWPVVDQVKDLQKPVLYLHANAEGSFQKYQPFGEADNFEAVQLERRGEEAPMKVVVGMKGLDPFLFTRREPTARDRYGE